MAKLISHLIQQLKSKNKTKSKNVQQYNSFDKAIIIISVYSPWCLNCIWTHRVIAADNRATTVVYTYSRHYTSRSAFKRFKTKQKFDFPNAARTEWENQQSSSLAYRLYTRASIFTLKMNVNVALFITAVPFRIKDHLKTVRVQHSLHTHPGTSIPFGQFKKLIFIFHWKITFSWCNFEITEIVLLLIRSRCTHRMILSVYLCLIFFFLK